MLSPVFLQFFLNLHSVLPVYASLAILSAYWQGIVGDKIFAGILIKEVNKLCAITTAPTELGRPQASLRPPHTQALCL